MGIGTKRGYSKLKRKCQRESDFGEYPALPVELFVKIIFKLSYARGQQVLSS